MRFYSIEVVMIQDRPPGSQAAVEVRMEGSPQRKSGENRVTAYRIEIAAASLVREPCSATHASTWWLQKVNLSVTIPDLEIISNGISNNQIVKKLGSFLERNLSAWKGGENVPAIKGNENMSSGQPEEPMDMGKENQEEKELADRRKKAMEVIRNYRAYQENKWAERQHIETMEKIARGLPRIPEFGDKERDTNENIRREEMREIAACEAAKKKDVILFEDIEIRDVSSGEAIGDISVVMASKPLKEVVGKRPFHIICEFCDGKIRMVTKTGRYHDEVQEKDVQNRREEKAVQVIEQELCLHGKRDGEEYRQTQLCQPGTLGDITKKTEERQEPEEDDGYDKEVREEMKYSDVSDNENTKPDQGSEIELAFSVDCERSENDATKTIINKTTCSDVSDNEVMRSISESNDKLTDHEDSDDDNGMTKGVSRKGDNVQRIDSDTRTIKTSSTSTLQIQSRVRCSRTRQSETRTESDEWRDLVQSVLVETQTSSYQRVVPVTSGRKAAQASKRKIRQIYNDIDERSDDEMSSVKSRPREGVNE